jgi:hypothetical protein
MTDKQNTSDYVFGGKARKQLLFSKRNYQIFYFTGQYMYRIQDLQKNQLRFYAKTTEHNKVIP